MCYGLVDYSRFWLLYSRDTLDCMASFCFVRFSRLHIGQSMYFLARLTCYVDLSLVPAAWRRSYSWLRFLNP